MAAIYLLNSCLR